MRTKVKGGQLTIALDGRGNVFTETFVDVEHVEVNSTQLDNKRMTDSFTGSDVGLQDAAKLPHRFCVLQNVHIL